LSNTFSTTITRMTRAHEVDTSGKRSIDLTIFVKLSLDIKKGKVDASKGFARVFTKAVTTIKVQGRDGAVHSFSEEERTAFVEHINAVLGQDADMKKVLPINPNNNDLFDVVKKGVLLCKLINCAVAGTLDDRVLNKGDKTNIHHQVENHNVCINSAKAIGCSIVNIGAGDLNEGKPHIVLGLVWQIIKIQLLQNVSLRACKELVLLLKDGESINDLLRLPPEEILLRWVNYHLAKAGSSKVIRNFTSDIKDSEAYVILLSQICPGQCTRDPLGESDLLKRADQMLRGAERVGCRKFVTPRDVVNGNQKLNLAFVATLFNTYPALELPTEAPPFDMAELMIDEGDSREERAFRNWMNSLGIEKFVNNLFEDSRDGLILLQTLDKISPGIVDWRQVNKEPKMVFKKVENCNYAVVLGKKLNFTLVNVGGKDIADGNKKLILALTWQMMRFHVLAFLKTLKLGSGKEVSEADMVKWANERVAGTGQSAKIDTFKDPVLKTGVFLLHLLSSVEPRAINWDLVTTGETDEQRKTNANYAISVARKLDCLVFCLWEDIVEVKPKMITTFVGAVMARAMGRSH